MGRLVYLPAGVAGPDPEAFLEVRLEDLGGFVAWLRLPPAGRFGGVVMLPSAEHHCSAENPSPGPIPHPSSAPPVASTTPTLPTGAACPGGFIRTAARPILRTGPRQRYQRRPRGAHPSLRLAECHSPLG